MCIMLAKKTRTWRLNIISKYQHVATASAHENTAHQENNKTVQGAANKHLHVANKYKFN